MVMKKKYYIVVALVAWWLTFLSAMSLPATALAANVARAETKVARAETKVAKNDLPKMVSLRWQNVNVRKGPGKEFPIVFSLEEKGMPLKLTRRHGDWREITDWQGSNGWVLRDSISDEKTLIVIVEETDLSTNPTRSATDKGKLVAKLKRGVTAKIIKCEPQWCQVETFIGGRAGWLRVLDTKMKF